MCGFKAGPFDSFSDGAIHVAVDSCSSFVSCLTQPHLTSDNAVWLIEKRAVPAFKKVGHHIDAVATSSSRVFGPTVWTFLANSSIKSHSGKGMGRGYIECFKTAVEKDFVLGQVCDREFNDFNGLRTAFNEWWRAYNEAPLDGFPNFGKSPSAMLRKPAA